MVADKDTPLEYTTIPSRENKKLGQETRASRCRNSALYHFMHSRETAIFGDKMRERARKLTKNTECDGLRAHSSVGRRRREFEFWAGGGGEETKDENDKKIKINTTKRTTFKGNLENIFKGN
jgi:hypothetical protein